MIELEGTDRERCIIVGVSTRAVGRVETEEYLNELELLADTAGADVVARMSQDRDRIDSATFIGKGKVEEIHKLIVEQTIPLVIFDDDLSAVQVRNLLPRSDSTVGTEEGECLELERRGQVVAVRVVDDVAALHDAAGHAVVHHAAAHGKALDDLGPGQVRGVR